MDAFIIEVSQRYIHPTPEAVERAFERLQLSGANVENRAKTAATCYSIRYTHRDGSRKSLKGL